MSVDAAQEAKGISIGRDALGNVLVAGDDNDVRVTIVVADSRLLGVFRGTEVGTTSMFNPYKGLDCFYETDSEYFCGRSKLVRRASVLFGKLQQGTSPRILPIVGPSGSGKSSLVRAGLVPELVRQPLAGFEEPQVLILRPGATPLARLADVIQRGRPTAGVSTADLQKAAPDGIYRALHGSLASSGDPLNRYLIVVDQFEELFTECTDSDARNAFLENLVFACGHVDHRVSVVFTLRNDFASSVRDPSAFLAAVRDNRLAIPGNPRCSDCSHRQRRQAHRHARALGTDSLLGERNAAEVFNYQCHCREAHRRRDLARTVEAGPALHHARPWVLRVASPGRRQEQTAVLHHHERSGYVRLRSVVGLIDRR